MSFEELGGFVLNWFGRVWNRMFILKFLSFSFIFEIILLWFLGDCLFGWESMRELNRVI